MINAGTGGRHEGCTECPREIENLSGEPHSGMDDMIHISMNGTNSMYR